MSPAHGARRLEGVVAGGEVGPQERLAGEAVHEPEVLVGGDVAEVPDERAHDRIDLRLEVGVAEVGDELEASAGARLRGRRRSGWERPRSDDSSANRLNRSPARACDGPMNTAGCPAEGPRGFPPPGDARVPHGPCGGANAHCCVAHAGVRHLSKEHTSARQHVRRARRSLERPAPQEGDLRAGSRSSSPRSSSAAPSASRTRPSTSARASRAAPIASPTTTSPRTPVRASSSRPARAAASVTPSVRKAVDDTIAAVSSKPGVAEVKSPFAKGNEAQIAQNGQRRPGDLRGPRRRGADRDDDHAGRRRGSPRPAPEPRRERRPVRRGERQQGAVQGLRGRLQEGRDAVAADHADRSSSSPSARSWPPASRCCSG